MWCDTADCRGKVKTNASVLFCALFVQHLLLTPISKDKEVITTTTFFILPKIGFLYRLSMSSKNKTRIYDAKVVFFLHSLSFQPKNFPSS